MTAEEVARQAVDADVHVVGVSSQAAGHMTLVPALVDALKKEGLTHVLVILGGIVPEPVRTCVPHIAVQFGLVQYNVVWFCLVWLRLLDLVFIPHCVQGYLYRRWWQGLKKLGWPLRWSSSVTMCLNRFESACLLL